MADAAAYLEAIYGGEEAVFGGGSAPSEAAGFERDFAAELDGFLARGSGTVPVVGGSWEEPKSGGTLEALLVSIGGDAEPGNAKPGESEPGEAEPGDVGDLVTGGDAEPGDVGDLVTGGEPDVAGEHPTAVLVDAAPTDISDLVT